MKNLSIFIDESGDFGSVVHLPAYYLVTLIFHDQTEKIDDAVNKLNESLQMMNIKVDYIHTGPIIRREEIFRELNIDERRKILYKLLNFYFHCPIRHTTIVVDRKNTLDKIRLSGILAKKLGEIIDANKSWLDEFDNVIVYYDYGQIELSSILSAVLSIKFNNVVFRKAEPQRYKLLQVADFVCSLKLLEIKMEEKRLTKSESQFFYKPQELKKTFLKSLKRKEV